MATEFKSRDELKLWLDGRSVTEAHVIANRAALRVLPLQAGIAFAIYDREVAVTVSTSAMFRACSVAWSAAKYPMYANELSRTTARAVAADAAWAGVAPADADPASIATIFATANAAYAAAAAVHTAYAPDAAASSANAVGYAAFGEVKEELWQSVSADVEALGGGLAPELLASRPLWPSGIPHSISAHWQNLIQILPPNEGWENWIAWDNRRLMGRTYSEDYELVFARVPNGKWKKGPAAANGWIKAELAKLELPLASDLHVAELIKTIEGDPEVATVEIVHGKAQLAESRNQDDFGVAEDPRTFQLHERVRKRALQARDKVVRPISPVSRPSPTQSMNSQATFPATQNQSQRTSASFGSFRRPSALLWNVMTPCEKAEVA